MLKVITVHSARTGTGKSTLVANMATLLAAAGQRVGVLDTNLKACSQHRFFGLPEEQITCAFNDYLLGQCDGTQITYDVTPNLNITTDGKLWLIPATNSHNNLKRVLGEGYVVELVTDGLHELAQHLALDVLLIDTPALLSDETLLSILSLAIADTVAIVLQLDQTNYQGTGVMIDVVRTLEVPRLWLVINQVAAFFDLEAVRQRVEQVYQCEVATVFPYVDEIQALAGTDLFVLKYPQHSIIHHMGDLTRTLIRQV
jgi:MinD-like ATPase involved in chromosome partitioning or flagellar assembly